MMVWGVKDLDVAGGYSKIICEPGSVVGDGRLGIQVIAGRDTPRKMAHWCSSSAVCREKSVVTQSFTSGFVGCGATSAHPRLTSMRRIMNHMSAIVGVSSEAVNG